MGSSGNFTLNINEIPLGPQNLQGSINDDGDLLVICIGFPMILLLMMTIIGIHSWLAEKESPAFAIETKKLMSQVLMRSAQIFITDYQYYVEENYQIE